MGPVLLLVAGMLIVVIGIIGLKWHPFIALTVAGLAVAGLTPVETLYRGALSAEERVVLIGSGGQIPENPPAEYLSAHQSAMKKAETWFVSRFTTAFGNGCGGIALIIAMAAIIGRCLLDSGGAKRVVDALMQLFDEKLHSGIF